MFGGAKCWSLSNELANVSVLGAMVVSTFINDAARVEYLMSLIAVLNNFELLMMTGKFCKNLVKLSGWTEKYQRNAVSINKVIGVG